MAKSTIPTASGPRAATQFGETIAETLEEKLDTDTEPEAVQGD